MSQNKSYTGIKKFYGSSLQAIIDNNEVKGYFVFGLLDKASTKENIYQLVILDNLLNETHSIELKKPTTFYLLESSFNGERFCFSFVDLKGKALEYLILDKAGKAVGTYRVTDLSNNEISAAVQASQSGISASTSTLTPINGKGFVRYGKKKEKGWRISLEMIDNDGKQKWTSDSGMPKTSKSYETAVPLYSDANYVVSQITTREKLLSTENMENNIVCQDATTGKEVFKISTNTAKYGLFPEGVSYDETSGEFFVYGAYAKLKDIVSLGIYIQVIDKSGKIKNESYSGWDKEILTATSAEIKSKMKEKMFIALHEMVRTSDGRFFAIGEQFHKAVSGLGVASMLLNSGAALTKIEVFNMMVYEFDKDLKISKVDVFEKDKRNVQLPQGLGLNGSTTLGYYLRMTGQFDYAYTSVSPDNKTFTAAYVNYDRDKEEGNKFVVGNIIYNQSKLTLDKVDLSSKATQFWIRPAKPGYVCIFEYFRKGKKLNIRMEKLNM